MHPHVKVEKQRNKAKFLFKGSGIIHKSVIKLTELVGICHYFLQIDCVFTRVMPMQRIIVNN